MPNKSPAVTRQGSERDLDLSAIEPGRETEAVTVRERLSITCRLVKDFQQEIQLLARSDRVHYSTATYVLRLLTVFFSPLRKRVSIARAEVPNAV